MNEGNRDNPAGGSPPNRTARTGRGRPTPLSRPILIGVGLTVLGAALLFWPRSGSAPQGGGERMSVVTSEGNLAAEGLAAQPRSGDVVLEDELQELVPEEKIASDAGAQKNLGPSGVTLVVIRDDILQRCNPDLPTMLKYDTFVTKNSLYNTAPTFGIYMLRNVLRWIKDRGGLGAMEEQNRAKAKLLYGCIEGSGGFYRNPVQVEDRSVMNVVFRLPSEDLEPRFIAAGKEAGFIGLKGHRSVGGCRASIYSAITIEAVEALADFMAEFERKNG